MKKLTKSICCSALLCGAIMLGGLGAQSLQAQADVNNAYFTMEGTSVRLDASNPGLRFTAKLGTDWYEVPVEATETVKPETTVSYGVFIFPLNVMELYNLYNVYDENADYLTLIREEAKDYFVYMEKKGASAILDLEAYPVAVDDDKDGNTDYYRINGSITNILYNNLNRDFFGLAYKKTGTFDAQTETYNYEYTYASYQGGDGSSATNVYNIAYVASCVYNMDWEGKTQADKDLLQGFVNKALQKAGGIAEKDAAANLEWDIELSQTSMTLNEYDKAMLSFTAKFGGVNSTLSLGATYTSSNSSAVTVDNKGNLTAVGSGSSTITVKCMEIEKTCTVTVQSALNFREIQKVGGISGGDKHTVDLIDENKAMRMNVTQAGANYEGYRISYDPITSGVMSFKVTNESESVLNLGIRIENDSNSYVTCTGSGENVSMQEGNSDFTIDGTKAMLITLEKDQSTIVTVTIANGTPSRMHLRPFLVNESYQGSFTVGEIYDGERPTGPVAHNVTVNGGSANPASALVGETVTLTPNVPEGYEFDRWQVVTGDVAVENNQFVMPNANVEITAIYMAIEYTVTVNNGTADPAKATIGETVTLTAGEAPAGQTFAGWQVVVGEIEIVNNQFVMPASDVEVTATYQDIVYYTVNVTNGTADPSSAAVGTVVTLTPNPAPDGQAFSGWEVVGITIENNQFVMPNHDVEITATYKLLYTITVTDGSASPESAIAGTTVTLTPNEAPEGQTFARWEVVSGEIEIVGNQFVMPEENVEITAIFQADEPALNFREIRDLVGDQGSGFTTSLSQDNISITVTPGSDKADYKGRLIGFDTITSNKISLTVSNANNSEQLQLVLRLLDSGKGVVNVTDCSGDNATIYDQYGNKYLLITLKAGASTTVTATVARENAISCIELRPFILAQTYTGSFTVGEIYDGERTGGGTVDPDVPDTPDEPVSEFKEIRDLVGDQGSGFTTSLSQDNISITVTPGSDKADYKGRLIGFDTITSNKISLTVSNANNSEQLQLVLRLLDSGKGVVNVTDCSGDNATIYDQYGNKYLLITLKAGASTTVTATVAKENAVSCIELRPFILAQTYTGSFTVGEIYDGAR